MYRTSDNGANWEQVNVGLPNKTVLALAVSATTLYAGMLGGGVYRTEDNGANWAEAATPFHSITCLE